MSLANDIAALSVAEIESSPKVEPPKQKDYSNEVFDSIISYIKAECIGFGSTVIMLDTVKDNYAFAEMVSTNYSAEKVMNLLRQNGFNVEVIYDHFDAFDVKITWHQGLPCKPNVNYTDKYKAVYKPQS